MTGPRSLKDTPLEGSFQSHQVPLAAAMSDDSQLEILSSWLKSYNVNELLVQGGHGDKPGEFIKSSVLRILPERIDRRLGMIKESFAGYEPLDVPDFEGFGTDEPGELSAMKSVASQSFRSIRRGLALTVLSCVEFLGAVIEKNPKSFRIFSPDGKCRFCRWKRY